MTKGVLRIATTELRATTIVEQLKTVGFPHYDISVLVSDKTGTRDFVPEQHTKAPRDAATGAGTNVVLGGDLPISGLGPFIAVGPPSMATLSGAAAGEAPGGLTGALLDLSIPEYEAKRYERKIKNGNILIFVHARDNTEREIAKAIFAHAGAEDIAYTEEAAVAKPELAVEDKGHRAIACATGSIRHVPTVLPSLKPENMEAPWATYRRRDNWMDSPLGLGNPDPDLSGLVSVARVHLRQSTLPSQLTSPSARHSRRGVRHFSTERRRTGLACYRPMPRSGPEATTARAVTRTRGVARKREKRSLKKFRPEQQVKPTLPEAIPESKRVSHSLTDWILTLGISELWRAGSDGRSHLPQK